jgi:predicted ester cyclase
MSAEEENKAVSRRVVEELFHQGADLDIADELFTPDYVGHTAGLEDIHGVEGFKQFAALYLQAFPDLQNTIEDQVAEGDKDVTRYRARGTHQGETEAFGPATGNRMEITGMVIDRHEGGKIAESWLIFDALGMMQQLGLVPQAEQV